MPPIQPEMTENQNIVHINSILLMEILRSNKLIGLIFFLK